MQFNMLDGQSFAIMYEISYLQKHLKLHYPSCNQERIDHLRQGPRIFRCDRMVSGKLTGAHFRLLPKQAFEPSLADDDLSL